MRPRALRSELARASFITTLVALLLTAGSLLLYGLVSYRHALVDDATAQAEFLAYSTASAVVFDDRKVASEHLALLQLKPSIRSATLFMATGEEFATYRMAGLDAGGVAVRRDAALETAGNRFDGEVLDVAYPIRNQGEVIGFVYLQAQHDMWQRAGTYAGILLVVMVLSLSISFLVFDRLQRRVTGRLLSVTQVAREVIAKRDWSLRAPESQNLDVGVLVQAFNAMLSEVQERTGELERSNVRLAQETLERRSAEEALKLQDKRKDEFIATLAHELRNPLAPMMNASALLRSPSATGSVRDRAATIIDRQLRHMGRLIEDLLDVSRVMTGKLTLHRERVDLSKVLESAVELAEPMVSQRHQRLTLTLPSQAHWVIGDYGRLSQTFSNLLNNASRYTPSEGSIEVTSVSDEGFAVVHVRDSGIGIEPAVQERIFGLFEQADKSLERGSAGLGIGLTLARQLAQLHGGTIAVASEGLGRGSCFTVRLPLTVEVADEDVEQVPRAEHPTKRLSVLVADDNVDYAQSLSTILESLGHTVRVVHNGLQALEAADDAVLDVALLDIGMPGLNGYEVARRLRERRGATPLRLIAITGWGQASDKETSAQAGFDEHLVKPVPIEDLLAALAR